jgi:hypothetical protein
LGTPSRRASWRCWHRRPRLRARSRRRRSHHQLLCELCASSCSRTGRASTTAARWRRCAHRQRATATATASSASSGRRAAPPVEPPSRVATSATSRFGVADRVARLERSARCRRTCRERGGRRNHLAASASSRAPRIGPARAAQAGSCATRTRPSTGSGSAARRRARRAVRRAPDRAAERARAGPTSAATRPFADTRLPISCGRTSAERRLTRSRGEARRAGHAGARANG